MVAQELPDAPRPVSVTAYRRIIAAQTVKPHFWDRRQLVSTAVTVGVRAADVALTCRTIAAGGRERWLPVKSCAGVAVWQAASEAGQVAFEWWLWRHGRARLRRWWPWLSVAPNVAGVAYTAAHGGRPRAKVGDWLPVAVAGRRECVNVWLGNRWVTRCE